MTKRRHPSVDPFPLLLGNPDVNSMDIARQQVALWHDLIKQSPKVKILLLPTMPRECEPDSSGKSGLGRTLENLEKAEFLDHIIIGVDGTKGDKSEFIRVCELVQSYNLSAKVHVMWNDSPQMVAYREHMAQRTAANNFGRLDGNEGINLVKSLENASGLLGDSRGLAPVEPGKGRNFWGMTGYCLALLDSLGIASQNSVIAIQDTDVTTDELGMITPRLFLAMCIDETGKTKFTKGHFQRYGQIGSSDAKLHGRVTRLFGPSFVNSVANVLQDQPKFNKKLRETIEFMNAFEYMFSGEMAFSGDVLEGIEIPNDYSMEIRILHQVHTILREKHAVASDTEVIPRYDHHHQGAEGVEKMATQIAAAFLDIVDGDIEVTQELVEKIQAAYAKRAMSEATDLTRVFSIQALASGMVYDREKERASIEMFCTSIQAGFEVMKEGLSAPTRSWNNILEIAPQAGSELLQVVRDSGLVPDQCPSVEPLGIAMVG